MNFKSTQLFSLFFFGAIALAASSCQLELNSSYATPTPTATPFQNVSPTPTISPTPTPTPTPSPTPAGTGAMISASSFGYACALSGNGVGNVFCWGRNLWGQLGNNTASSSSTPGQVVGVGGTGFLSNIQTISAGGSETCASSAAGNVYCWGLNMDGELGNNSTTASNAPVEVVGVGGVGFLSGITQVSSNDGTTCALSSAGNVYCWGDNISGTLGNNTYTNSQTPVEVLGVGGTGFLSNIVQILNSDDTACGLSSSGNVFCWGDDYADQLGDNEANEYSATPIEVPGVGETGFLSGIASLAQGQGDGTLCALSLAGNVYCWGYNTAGELGDNSTSSVMGPVEVVGVGGVGFLSGIASLGASADTVCAVSSAGNQYCWGLNTYGELGNNSTTNSSVPVEVVGVGGTGILSSVVSASSGRYIGCAIVTSGNIYCWGDNSFGELGINSTTNSLTPVEVMGVGGTGVLSLY